MMWKPIISIGMLSLLGIDSPNVTININYVQDLGKSIDVDELNH